MKRSIPQRGSVGAIGATQMSRLTDGQRAALELLQSKEEQKRLVAVLAIHGSAEQELTLKTIHEARLYSLGFELTIHDQQHAAAILQSIDKNGQDGSVSAFLNAVAQGLVSGIDPVLALREALDAYTKKVASMTSKRGQR